MAWNLAETSRKAFALTFTFLLITAPLFAGIGPLGGISPVTPASAQQNSWTAVSGSEFWSVDVDRENDTIYAGSKSGNLYKIDSDGTVLKNVSIASSTVDGIEYIPSENEVLVGTRDGTLHKYDPSFTEQWNVTIADEARAVAYNEQDNVAYVATGPTNDYIEAYYDSNQTQKWSVSTAGVWSLTYDTQNNLAIGGGNGEIFAYDNTGTQVYSKASGSSYHYGLASYNGDVFAQDKGGYAMQKYGSNGTNIWNNSVTGGYAAGVSANQELGYFGIDSSTLGAYSFDGTQQWTHSVGSTTRTIAINDETNTTIYAATYSGVTKIDTQDSLNSSVTGTVVDGSGNPIDSADVTIEDSSGSAVWSGTTNSTGGWSTNLGDGDYTVTAEKPDYYNNSTTFSVSGSAVSGVNLTLGQPVVDGQVVDQNGDPVSNATVKMVAVDYRNITPQAGQTYEERAQELIDDARDPLPENYDRDLQLTGATDSLAEQAENADANYLLVHDTDDWGLSKWSEEADLTGTGTVNPTAGEDFVVSCVDGSKSDSFYEHSINRQVKGKFQSCEFTAKRVDSYNDTIDSMTFETDESFEFSVTRSTPIKTISLPAGVYVLETEGQVAPVTIVVGDEQKLADAFESELKNEAGQYSEKAKSIRDKYDTGKFRNLTVATNETGHFSATVGTNSETVALAAYKIDGEVMTNMTDPSLADMRTWVESNNYNGSVYVSSTPDRVSPPSTDTTVRVTELPSPPYEHIGDWQNKSAWLENYLQNLTYSELSDIHGDLSKYNDTELTEIREQLAELADNSNDRQTIVERYREVVGRDDAKLDELADSNKELREQIGALEQALEEQKGSMKTEVAGCSVSDGKVDCEYMFGGLGQPGGELSEDRTVVLVKYADGSIDRLTPAKSSHVSVDSRAGRRDAVLVESYPLKNGSALADVQVIAVADDGSLGRASEKVENPYFSGSVPDLRSVNINTLRPATGDTVSFTVNTDASIDSVSVVDKNRNSVNATLDTDGRVTFTPETTGKHTVTMNLTGIRGNSYQETLRVAVGDTNYPLPYGVRISDGRLGTYAVVGDGLSGGDVSLSGDTTTVSVLVGETDDVPTDVNVYAGDELGSGSSEVTVRVLRGDQIETASSVGQHVGVTIQSRQIDDDAIVYRHTPSGKVPVTEDDRVQTGTSTRLETYTAADGSVTVTVNNAPSIVDRAFYRGRVIYQGAKDRVGLFVVPSSLPGLWPETTPDLRG